MEQQPLNWNELSTSEVNVNDYFYATASNLVSSIDNNTTLSFDNFKYVFYDELLEELCIKFIEELEYVSIDNYDVLLGLEVIGVLKLDFSISNIPSLVKLKTEKGAWDEEVDIIILNDGTKAIFFISKNYYSTIQSVNGEEIKKLMKGYVKVSWNTNIPGDQVIFSPTLSPYITYASSTI